jgi:O-antigen/teichoic acid export membrane protein
VFVHRGRSVCLIQIAQTVIGSSDLLAVGLLSSWALVGQYGAPHRMIMAILTFGLIFQQVAFPTLARSWREAPDQGRQALDVLVKVLMLGLIPVGVGAAVLSRPLVKQLFSGEYEGTALLLALGIWRAPLLTLAFLYQAALIAVNRESAGVRLLVFGAAGSGPLAALLYWNFGLPGASVAILFVGFLLVVAGYTLLAREGRQPVWHHHLARPLIAAAAMAPVGIVLARWHVLLAVAGGAVTYLLVLSAVGGFRREDLRAILARQARPTAAGRGRSDLPEICAPAGRESGKAELEVPGQSW